MQYNEPFFTALSNAFLLVKEKYGERTAIRFFKDLMERNLRPVYDGMNFEKGNPYDFARVVKERDEAVGLRVTIGIENNVITYRLHTDPFPLLRGRVNPHKLDETYMDFKVRYLLGNWGYETTKHLWEGDECTEHLITKF